jgi:hypothetical protein
LIGSPIFDRLILNSLPLPLLVDDAESAKIMVGLSRKLFASPDCRFQFQESS